ncbi:Ribonuclease R [compost metagenome]
MKLQMNIKTGVVSAHPKGFGFLTTDEQEEFFVPPPLMRKAVPGDRVSCNIIESPRKPGQLQAGDIRVLERQESTWQGTVNVVNGRHLLVPDSPCFMNIEVCGLDFVPADCVVSVRTERIDLKAPVLRTRLERVLGPRTRRGFDQDYSLAHYDFPQYFDNRALSEAEALSLTLSAADRKGRRDLTGVPLVTIDGESTRDFDDAVYAEKKADGSYRVLVAIADVSHYVKPGSALNRAAYERATSVYLPGKTVPMLPEKLSNGVCSLVPGEDRLVVVAELELDAKAGLRTSKFYRGVMRSAARLTYNEVQAWMDGDGAMPLKLEPTLLAMREVFERLLAARKERGQLEFEDSEAKLKLREDGEYMLEFEQRTDSHKLVEELMLMANQAVALKLKDMHAQALFRHQALPDQEDWNELALWAQEHGLTLAEAQPSLKALAGLIAHAHTGGNGLKAELRVRSVMQSAAYEPTQPTHFSLGYPAYTHFTSPIRRLADLLVHRLLLGEELGGNLEELAAQCSERSRDSHMAERYVWDRLKKRIVAREVGFGAALRSHVVSASKRGLRVVMPDWQCSALIEADALLAHGCEFDSDKGMWANGCLWEPGHALQVSLVMLEDADGRTELYAVPEGASA